MPKAEDSGSGREPATLRPTIMTFFPSRPFLHRVFDAVMFFLCLDLIFSALIFFMAWTLDPEKFAITVEQGIIFIGCLNFTIASGLAALCFFFRMVR